MAPDTRRSTTPPGPSASFTGREDILKQLDEYFDESSASVQSGVQRVFAIIGMGGAGKTQIALKFVSMYRVRYEIPSY